MTRLERLGEFIRNEGQENRHNCLTCGIDGLLVNWDRNVWYCFGCCKGGKVDVFGPQTVNWHGPVTLSTEHRYTLREMSIMLNCPRESLRATGLGVPPGNALVRSAYMAMFPPLDDVRGRLQFYRGIVQSMLIYAYCIYPKIQGVKATARGYLAFDLDVREGDPPGMLVYQPDHALRYRTAGTRGLLRFGDVRTCRVCFIVEGLFDALAIQACCTDRKDVMVVATLGKSVTAYQRDLLGRIQDQVYVPHKTKAVVYGVALDPDAALEAVTLLRELESYGETFLMLPHGDTHKDWDALFRSEKGGRPCMKAQIDCVLKRWAD